MPVTKRGYIHLHNFYNQLSLKTMMEEIKLVAIEQHEFKYREMLKLIVPAITSPYQDSHVSCKIVDVLIKKASTSEKTVDSDLSADDPARSYGEKLGIKIIVSQTD